LQLSFSGGIMDVQIKGTSTQNIPNSSCSHASIVSDMYFGGGGGGGGRVSHKNEKNLPTKSKEKYLYNLKFYKKFQLKQTILAENPPGLHYLSFCDHSKSKAFINFVNIYEQLMLQGLTLNSHGNKNQSRRASLTNQDDSCKYPPTRTLYSLKDAFR
jgi:hypothetical protein